MKFAFMIGCRRAFPADVQSAESREELGFVEAFSPQEAVSRARGYALAKYPLGNGWNGHTERVAPVDLPVIDPGVVVPVE